MKVRLVAAGGFWAPEVAAGLRSLGIDAQEISVRNLPSSQLRYLASQANRAASRLNYPATIYNELFGLAALGGDRSDVLVMWSSHALGSLLAHRNVVLVRGSTHIRTQRRILAAGPSPKPTRVTVRAETIEYRRAAFVTVPTLEIAADPEWAADGARVVPIPFGFPQTALRRPRRNAASPLRLMFAGEIGWRKGVDRLQRSLRYRPPEVESFVLCGRRTGQSAGWRLPVWWDERGQVPSPTLRTIMDHSDALILLSREEGMARVGLEAMARGTPVVASEASGLSQWLSQGAGIVIPDPDDIMEFRSSLDEVMRNWRAMSDACLSVARSWTWADHSRSLAENIAKYIPLGANIR